MQVRERESLGYIRHYCWGCGRMSIIDAKSCMCKACDDREFARVKARSAARQHMHPDKYDLGTGRAFTRHDYEQAA